MDRTATDIDYWLRYLYSTGRYNDISDGASDSHGPHCVDTLLIWGDDFVGQQTWLLWVLTTDTNVP